MNGSIWKGWGVSQIGPSHIQNSTLNQDAYIVKSYKWGIVAAVCDGLGSKKFSHIGSQALVHSFVEACKLFDFEKDIKLFEPLLYSLWRIKIAPHNVDETATTLLFAIVINSKVYIGRVGDGAIAILGRENLTLEEDKDSFTNYTTPFGRKIPIEWSIFDADDIESIALCSDGISEDIKKEKLLDFFQNYVETYKYVPSMKRTCEIKQWLKDWPVKGHSDDKTIVALTKGMS